MSTATQALQAHSPGRTFLAPAAPWPLHLQPTRRRLVPRLQASNAYSQDTESPTSRRQYLASLAGAAALAAAGSAAAPLAARAQRFNDELVTSSSGLRIMDIKAGEGTAPKPGDV